MRRSFLKLLGAALALCLVLSGCNMIKVDQAMQLKEDLAALEKEAATVLVDYDGGQVTLNDVGYEYIYQLNYASMMYSVYGMSLDDSALTSLKENVLVNAMNTRATLAKAEELGIALTDEELAECEENAQSAYQEQYDKYFSESATGDTDEIKALDTEYALRQSGLSLDVLLYNEKAAKLIEKVEEQVKGEVSEVTDEQLQDAFDVKVAEDEGKYDGDTEAFETAAREADTKIYWYPAGYRTVKHVLVAPEESYLTAVSEKQAVVDDLQAQLDDLTAAPADEAEEAADAAEEVADEAADAAEEAVEATEEAADAAEEAVEATEEEAVDEPADEADEAVDAAVEPADEAAADSAEVTELKAQLAAAQAELDEAKAAAIGSVQAKLDDIAARLEAGEDFQTMIDEYGEDPGMESEPAASVGYYVSEATTSLDPAFKEAALALAEVGDISEPTLGQYGVHIIRYEADVPAGAVDFDSVRDALRGEVLGTTQNDYYDEQLDAWVAAMNPVYHADRWQ